MCTCKMEDKPFADQEFDYNYRTNSFGDVDELIPESVYRSVLDKAEMFCNVTGLALGVEGHDFDVEVDGQKFLKASRIAQVLGHVEVVKMKLAAGLPCERFGYGGLDCLAEFDTHTMRHGLNEPAEFATRLSKISDMLNELGSLGWKSHANH